MENNRGAEVALHPWCIHCGLVKNISDDKSRKIGYWINVLSKISNRFSITQSQKRLIVKELMTYEEFEDPYGITSYSQRELFFKIIKKHCNINTHNLNSFVC